MATATKDPCPCVLIAPQIEADDGTLTTAGLYRWEEGQGVATLVVDAMPDYRSFHPDTEAAHDLAHCDGLLLVPTDAAVRVLNPATGRAFGLGCDPRSGAYMVVRIFYRSLDEVELYAGGCTYTYSLGAEVLTLTAGGTDQCWRETAAPPPCPVIPGRTATFFKGSLLFTPHERVLDGGEAPGFVRFSLEDNDEPFGVVPGPPCEKRIDYAASSMAELRGELWLCVGSPRPGMGSVEMWACGGDLTGARWDRRHVVEACVFRGNRSLRPMTASAGAILLRAGPSYLWRYRRRGCEPGYGDLVDTRYLKYHHPDNDAGTVVVEYPMKTVLAVDVVPYVPSLVPI
ncbi:uncharacterized protein [Aegilops tauschii subsp. strangulata]|uniref:uncharacterized protein n=1 Tax=Aegilops tauschii subsp. strangulata TaxID=200361 RepID=UPI00098AAB69|nr:uncharacterized protein LOC109777989 [Aegilops tauschii subsp. strangulata]